MISDTQPISPPNGVVHVSQPVGFVVGESHPQEFLFVSSSEVIPPLLERAYRAGLTSLLPARVLQRTQHCSTASWA